MIICYDYILQQYPRQLVAYLYGEIPSRNYIFCRFYASHYSNERIKKYNALWIYPHEINIFYGYILGKYTRHLVTYVYGEIPWRIFFVYLMLVVSLFT